MIFDPTKKSEGATPELVAKYNGVAKILRPTNIFEILPLGTISQAPTFGAHARSWARFEGGELVLLAFRPPIRGEENPLASQETDPRVKDIVHSDAPAIISSRDAQSITRSRTLASFLMGVERSASAGNRENRRRSRATISAAVFRKAARRSKMGC